MFRAERPAKGRFRQFFQAGCELFGDAGPASDAELIAMTTEIVEALGVRDYEVHVNSLGSAATRGRYRDALRDYLAPQAASLSEDSRRRLETNPLRILDSKSPADAAAVAGAPSILELLEPQDQAHFERVCTLLTELGVRYLVDPRLVRGLDYYTRTLFELRETSGQLGAQAALLGGGRYDGMIQSLGGPSVPAIGFAMGLERLLEVMPAAGEPDRLHAIVLPMGEPAQGAALRLGRELRAAGLRCEVDGRGLSVRAMLRRANGTGARFALLLGDDELDNGTVTVKDLAAHEQSSLPIEGLGAELARRLTETPPVAGAPAAAAPAKEAPNRDG
jgi:histidyl-tRNA synthetase